MQTIEEVKALIGQVHGPINDRRIITRIENLRTIWGGLLRGHVYWKRPDGKERQIGKNLQNYLAWLRKVDRVFVRTPVYSLRQVKAFLGTIPQDADVDGYVSNVDGQVTVSFKVVANA